MATAWRKVKGENDIEFTIQDMINIYYGELEDVYKRQWVHW